MYKAKKLLTTMLVAGSFMLGSMIPAKGLEYKLEPDDGAVKRVKIWIEEHDNRLVDAKFTDVVVRRTFVDGREVTERYSHYKSEKGFLEWKHKKLPDGKEREEYFESSGKPVYIIDRETLPDGTIKQHMDQDGDGKVDFLEYKKKEGNKTIKTMEIKGAKIELGYTIEETLPNKTKVEKNYETDGKLRGVYTTEVIEGVKVKKYDFDADGAIDRMETEQKVGEVIIRKDYERMEDGTPEEIVTSRVIEFVLIPDKK